MLPVCHSALENTACVLAAKTLRAGVKRHAILQRVCHTQHIEAGVTLADAINFLVEKYDLVRVDTSSNAYAEPEIFLTAADILEASHATGLTQRNLS